MYIGKNYNRDILSIKFYCPIWCVNERIFSEFNIAGRVLLMLKKGLNSLRPEFRFIHLFELTLLRRK